MCIHFREALTRYLIYIKSKVLNSFLRTIYFGSLLAKFQDTKSINSIKKNSSKLNNFFSTLFSEKSSLNWSRNKMQKMFLNLHDYTTYYLKFFRSFSRKVVQVQIAQKQQKRKKILYTFKLCNFPPTKQSVVPRENLKKLQLKQWLEKL